MPRRATPNLTGIALDPASAVPLYQQICDALRAAILAGQLPLGKRLPSTRTLAAHLGVARNTTSAAIDQLMSEGYLEAWPGDATYVACELPAPVQAPAGERAQDAEAARERSRQTVGVVGLVRDDGGRVLLVETPVRGWDMPGGRVEHGEDLPAALVREVAEESGCAVRVGRLLGVYTRLGEPYDMLIFTFRCEFVGGEVSAGHECLGAGWFTPEEAQRRVTHPGVAARLADALEERAGMVYRAYRTEEVVGDEEGGVRWVYSVVSEYRT